MDVVGGRLVFIIALAPPVGFEPTTLGLEVLCSIQLSYQGTLPINRYIYCTV